MQFRPEKEQVCTWFSDFTISYFTTKGFQWLSVCVHLYPQLVVKFIGELPSLSCIPLYMECQSLLSLPPPLMISQSFFLHSIDCLYMSEYFSHVLKLWKKGKIHDWLQIRECTQHQYGENWDIFLSKIFTSLISWLPTHWKTIPQNRASSITIPPIYSHALSPALG